MGKSVAEFTDDRRELFRGDVVVHSADKRTEIPKGSLDLGGLRELELLVDVESVLDRPPLIDRPINGRAIRTEFRPWLHVLLEEERRMVPLDARRGEHFPCKLPRTGLLPHEQGSFLRVHLIHLDEFR